jgi:hypothetical protein
MDSTEAVSSADAVIGVDPLVWESCYHPGVWRMRYADTRGRWHGYYRAAESVTADVASALRMLRRGAHDAADLQRAFLRHGESAFLIDVIEYTTAVARQRVVDLMAHYGVCRSRIRAAASLYGCEMPAIRKGDTRVDAYTRLPDADLTPGHSSRRPAPASPTLPAAPQRKRRSMESRMRSSKAARDAVQRDPSIIERMVKARRVPCVSVCIVTGDRQRYEGIDLAATATGLEVTDIRKAIASKSTYLDRKIWVRADTPAPAVVDKVRAAKRRRESEVQREAAELTRRFHHGEADPRPRAVGRPTRAVIGVDIETGEAMRFDSLISAEAAGYRASSISLAARGYMPSHGGRVWLYEDSYTDTEALRLRCVAGHRMPAARRKRRVGVTGRPGTPVMSVDPVTGERQTYAKMSDVDGVDIGGISQCVAGKKKTAGGRVWVRSDAPETEVRKRLEYAMRAVSREARPVIGVDIATGDVRRYDTVTSTADAGAHPLSVSNCASGKAHRHRGRAWLYADELDERETERRLLRGGLSDEAIKVAMSAISMMAANNKDEVKP